MEAQLDLNHSEWCNICNRGYLFLMASLVLGNPAISDKTVIVSRNFLICTVNYLRMYINQRLHCDSVHGGDKKLCDTCFDNVKPIFKNICSVFLEVEGELFSATMNYVHTKIEDLFRICPFGCQRDFVDLLIPGINV